MVSYDARAPFPKYGEPYDMSKIKIIDHECKEECATCLTNDRGDDSALGEIDKNYERK